VSWPRSTKTQETLNKKVKPVGDVSVWQRRKGKLGKNAFGRSVNDSHKEAKNRGINGWEVPRRKSFKENGQTLSKGERQRQGTANGKKGSSRLGEKCDLSQATLGARKRTSKGDHRMGKRERSVRANERETEKSQEEQSYSRGPE